MSGASKEHDAAFARIGEALMTGMKLKREMLDTGRTRLECPCPRCGGTLRAGLAGPKNHLRMACEGQCGMNMME